MITQVEKQQTAAAKPGRLARVRSVMSRTMGKVAAGAFAASLALGGSITGASADTEGVSTLITTGFAEVTTVLLVIFGAAFSLTALVVAAVAGIKWVRRIGKSG